MKVGVLLITHDNLGKALLDTAATTLGHCPLDVELLGVTRSDDPDDLRERARAAAQRLDKGAGVLVLTDMYGSTPSNVACSLLVKPQVQVVTGVNLPMLFRVFNYPNLELGEMVEKALSGGTAGVLHCGQVEEEQPR